MAGSGEVGHLFSLKTLLLVLFALNIYTTIYMVYWNAQDKGAWILREADTLSGALLEVCLSQGISLIGKKLLLKGFRRFQDSSSVAVPLCLCGDGFMCVVCLCNCLFLVSLFFLFFCASGSLGFEIATFHGYLHLYFWCAGKLTRSLKKYLHQMYPVALKIEKE